MPLEKALPLVLLILVALAAFLNGGSQQATADVSPEMARMIQQDHLMVGLIVNYIEELQKRGVLPRQEEAGK